jgi:DHA1 family bicyclomycin/chloramphenicol resistance-like MFS transporter
MSWWAPSFMRESVPTKPLVVGSTRWVITLATMTAIIALSIDMSLPAQPVLVRTFGIAEETAQLTLSTFMIGFAVAQLFVGYLADAWGRRRVLVAGLAVFTLAGIACALAPNIEMLLVCRTLQGIGGSAAPVIARAMVRDTQPAAQAARLLSTMLATLAIAPMVAPFIGGLLLDVLDWHAIFAFLAIVGVVQLVVAHTSLVETLPTEKRSVPSARGLIRNYREFFSTRAALLPLAVMCSAFAGQFAYIADSPFIYVEGFGMSNQEYGVYFGTTALALMLGSLTGARMLKAGRAPSAMLVIGAVVILAGGVLVFAGTRLDLGGPIDIVGDYQLDPAIAGFFLPMLVYFFGVGLAGPSAGALTLEPVPHIAGTASAALGTLQMTSGAVAGYLATKIGGSDPHVFALIATVMAMIAALLAWSTVLARKRRQRV